MGISHIVHIGTHILIENRGPKLHWQMDMCALLKNCDAEGGGKTAQKG